MVNRIQNRRKEMDLRAAVERHREYILEETQGDELAARDDVGAALRGSPEWISAVIEGSEISFSIFIA